MSDTSTFTKGVHLSQKHLSYLEDAAKELQIELKMSTADFGKLCMAVHAAEKTAAEAAATAKRAELKKKKLAAAQKKLDAAEARAAKRRG